MERETKELIMPVSKQKVIIKSWLVAREKRVIKNAFLGGSVVNPDTEKLEISDGATDRLEDAQIEVGVVSVDGSLEGLKDVCLDMRSEDFDFLMKEVSAVTSPELAEDAEEENEKKDQG